MVYEMMNWPRQIASLTGILLGCSLAFCAGAAGSEFTAEPTAKAAQRWGVPAEFIAESQKPLRARWSRRLTGYLAARDGTSLRYSVLLPAGAGPFPVVVNYSGYDPGAIGGYAYQHGNTAMSAQLDATLLEHGYAVLGVNARGTGCSEGVFDFLGPAYGRDGADIIEWAARQSWSTGSIGMANWSWAGMSQVATASERPEHLKAIAPGMALTDPRRDSFAIGGVASQGFVTGWWMFLHSRWLSARHSAEVEHDERCLLQVERNFMAADLPASHLPGLLLQHPQRDSWQEERNIHRRANLINVPVLSMEVFQDEATTVRAGYYQELLDPERLWLIQSNGNHDLYESLQFRSILVSFFDHFVKGIDNGFERRPHVETWFETTSIRADSAHDMDESAQSGWVLRYPRFPAPTETMELRLADGARLLMPGEPDDTGGGDRSDPYHYPVEGPPVDLDSHDGQWGAAPSNWKEGSVAYTSAALLENTVAYGPASADLWISASSSDADVQVTLTDVLPDGQERFVQRGWLRLSNRALDQERSTPTRPWSCDEPRCVQALTPGIPVLARVEIFKLAHAFRAGSRIRIWIDAPSATGGLAFDHTSLASTNAIWHGVAHPSRLVLGTLKNVNVPKPIAPCSRALMQPCRPDPLAQARH